MDKIQEQQIIEGNRIIAENYLIDLDGSCYSIKSKKKIIASKGTGGYFQYNFSINGRQMTRLVHRLVALKWIPNPNNKPEVNHIDGDKSNNHVSNLEWVSRSENIRHGISTELIPAPWKNKSGLLHPKSKTVLQCDSLGYEIKEFGSTMEAERITGISAKHIQDVCRGKGVSAGGYKWKYKDN